MVATTVSIAFSSLPFSFVCLSALHSYIQRSLKSPLTSRCQTPDLYVTPRRANQTPSALYAHKIHSGFWHDVNLPESFGFAAHQVTPFNISTPDSEILYAWHILPLASVAANRDALAAPDKFDQSLPLRLLKDDEKARVVINCEFLSAFCLLAG